MRETASFCFTLVESGVDLVQVMAAANVTLEFVYLSGYGSR